MRGTRSCEITTTSLVALEESSDIYIGGNDKFWGLGINRDTDPKIFVVCNLHSQDPPAHEPDFVICQKEGSRMIDGKMDLEEGQYRIYSIDSNISGGRFVMTLKNFQTFEETPERRYIVQGYIDSEMPLMVHDVTALCLKSMRITLGIRAAGGLRKFPMTSANRIFSLANLCPGMVIYNQRQKTQVYVK